MTAARLRPIPTEPQPEDSGQTVTEALVNLVAHRIQPGGSVLDAPECVESVWGVGHRCMWARGEPFVLVGPDGTGKTSIAQQLVIHMVGVRAGPFLGMNVSPPAGRVLYVAADRPTQALRSFRRMVTEDDREKLDDRLVIWRGPLPFDLGREPMGLLELARRVEAGAVVIDSLKDCASDLVKDEGGQGINRALQHAVAEGVDLCLLHHQRKAQAGGTKPNSISDVYGSRWLTAGAGSVAMVWGQAGDPVVELTHLKQPDEVVGPLEVVHDHVAGVSRVEDHVDAAALLRGAANGLSAAGCAYLLCKIPPGEQPSRNQIERARRQLERLTKEGRAHRHDGSKGGDATLYFAVDTRHQEAG